MAGKKLSPAAIFLFIIVGGIVAVLAFFVWLGGNERMAIQIAFTPSHDIATEEMAAAPDYTDRKSVV